MEKKILPYLVVISALSVSLSAAFYSVSGIGKMFSGSSTNVMIMMASLEVAKLVLASLLYQYWDKLNLLLKSYYIIGLFTLMSITSAGIYGYLSSAYSQTSSKVENIDKQVELLNKKRDMFELQLSDIKSEKKMIEGNISDITKGLSNNNQSYKDKSGVILTTTSSANRKVFEKQLSDNQKRRDDLNSKESNLNDSISKLDLLKLDLETNTDLAGEVGPLKYIAKITNKSMDIVVNWFIIALMLVFDPLAVSLVIGANIIFMDKKKMDDKIDLSKQIDSKIEKFKEIENDIELKKSEFTNREIDIKNKELEFNNKVSNIESSLKEKELKLYSDIKLIEDNFKLKEEENSKLLSDKLLSIENEFSHKNDELLKLKEDLDVKSNELTSKEQEILIKIDNLNKLELDLMGEKESIKDEKKVISKIREKLNDDSKLLLEDKKDIDNKLKELESVKNKINMEKKSLNFIKDDLIKLDNEIKEWEKLHWKLQRNPPPSAITD